MAADSPTIRRRQLMNALKRLRESAGLTQERAAEQLDWHHTKIFRIETGRTGPHPNDVRAMLDVYGVTDKAERDALIQLAKDARKRGWWYSYRDVLPSKYESYIGMEAEATSIREFHVAAIPGLLQTEGYATAFIRGGPLELDEDEIRRRVEVRMTRQHILRGPDRPQLWVILDEAAIHRAVGGPAVMRGQLEHLLAVARGRTTLQLVPYSVGAHPGATGNFSLLSFPESSDADAAYVEIVNGNLWIDRAEEVERFATAFDHLRAVAVSPEDTRAMLIAALNEYK
ncbi:helix-turn-helix domain-containing protein [Thermomonospora umbrina]|uniref:Helix-turn-helix protein n=1 Tax=Thermomonospora umbrina TaxID=111806 RepID=A0A3D9SJS4_9ACTN|nr:helix-turn-helix transcriptional regulator [Thermomonospora umbrina]REE96139.1 helix-turn-helix protein [Thermomonospora umbrina]